MPSLCFKNGSAVREIIRNQFVREWNIFNNELTKTYAGNNGQFGFYFLEPEIIPSNLYYCILINYFHVDLLNLEKEAIVLIKKVIQ
jgi:hypothetical protein